MPVKLHDVVKGGPLHGVNELSGHVAARIVSVLKDWRIQCRRDEGLYRIVKALSIHDPNGPIVIQQIERDGNDWCVEACCPTLLRPATGHCVEPAATGDSGRANSRRLKIAGERLNRVEISLVTERHFHIF